MQNDGIQGIDVSHFVGDVDWSTVKEQGKLFGFAKASEGLHTNDAQFANNWSGMKNAGVLRGAYHFYHPNESPDDQATHFLGQMGELQDGDLPPVLDLEVTDGESNISAGVLTWLQKVEDATGRRPILYVGGPFSNENLTGIEFAKYPLWLPEYGVSTPRVGDIWKEAGWTFWQYSESGDVEGAPGGRGSTDLDVYNGSLDDLKKFVADSKVTT